MQSHNYIDVRERECVNEPTSFFMLNCLLRSRIKLNLESNETVFDEDVNIYIANLMDKLTYSTCFYHLDASISKHDSEVVEMVDKVMNTREKFEIYRKNADHFLLWLGLFSDESSDNRRMKKYWRYGFEFYKERTRSYYEYASIFAAKTFGRNSALADIMIKIANDLDKYLNLLSHIKSEHLNLGKRFSDGEFFHLTKYTQAPTSKHLVKDLQNRFLDLYSEWLKTGDGELGLEIKKASTALRKVDSTFGFEGIS